MKKKKNTIKKKPAAKKKVVKKSAAKKAVTKKVVAKEKTIKKSEMKHVAKKRRALLVALQNMKMHGVIFAKTRAKKASDEEETEAEAEAETKSSEEHSNDNDHVTTRETLDPTHIYLRELGFKSLLTATEELRVARRVKKGDKAARAKMIESNLRLVVKIARHYCNRGLAFLDLIEEGNLGLMTAVEKFDPERGFRFSTYATWWIRQTIERAIMNQSRTVRLPIHIIKELNVYLRAAKKLAQVLDHQPTAMEIAEVVDKPVEDVQEALSLVPGTTSIDAPVIADSHKTLVDILADDNNVDPAGLVQQQDMEINISQWLDHLTERERAVIVRRFGLENHDRGTLEEVGKAVGLTRERVRQLQIDALSKLRKIMESEGLTREDVEVET